MNYLFRAGPGRQAGHLSPIEGHGLGSPCDWRQDVEQVPDKSIDGRNVSAVEP
ncbi:hypothetical protein AB0I28_19770 [Phytomonospora sp. NPDC050363]|uniref:hypothetical protein n=1 Tax=Phytomonospora sp. NPDC050363 TaxID=3155642 RepID=UPI0033EDC91E